MLWMEDPRIETISFKGADVDKDSVLGYVFGG